jgi:hypothetical protein
VARLRALLAAGLSVPAIAREMGLTTGSVEGQTRILRAAAQREALAIRTGPWSRDETLSLMRMTALSTSSTNIGRRLRRDPADVKARRAELREAGVVWKDESTWPCAWGDGPPPPPPPRPRLCLKCRGEFLSDGAHHRVCDPCKDTPVWRAWG